MTKEKKVAIYLYNLSNQYEGLGEFNHNLAIRMSAQAAELKAKHNIKLCFLVPAGMTGAYGEDVEYLVLKKWRYRLLNESLPRCIKHLFFPKVDLVHWTQQLPRLHTTLSPHTFVTIHDVNYFHNNLPEDKVKKRSKKINRTLRHATHLSFISQFAQDDVVSRFDVPHPKRIIYNGVTDQMQVPQEKIDGLPNQYLLSVSGLDDKKNVHLLIEMMRFLPNEFLVIAGRGNSEYTKMLYSLVERYQLTNVRFVGCVSAGEKAYLYRNCKAFFFVSKSEGFGLPVAEAMTASKPVFCSKLTSLPEIGGDAAYYFDELEPEKMAQTTQKLLAEYEKDPETRQKMCLAQAQKFNWDKAVDEYLNYYIDILQEK